MHEKLSGYLIMTIGMYDTFTMMTLKKMLTAHYGRRYVPCKVNFKRFYHDFNCFFPHIAGMLHLHPDGVIFAKKKKHLYL